MNQNFFTKLAKDAEQADLPFLIVGGHAVNAYGYQRTTLDADLLIATASLDQWTAFWEKQGYRCAHKTEAFYQFETSDSQERFPVDLMVVDEATFEKIYEQKQTREIGGAEFAVPAPLHLVAMKLHALHNSGRSALGKDLLDIVGLIRTCEIDVQSVGFQEVLNRYANEKTKAEITRQLG